MCLPPPHPAHNVTSNTIVNLRFRIQIHAEINSVSDHASDIAVGGKSTCVRVPEVKLAVVPTVNVTGCDPLPLRFMDELDRPQVGAGVAAGVIAQVRLAVPLNDPAGASIRLKVAVCPALTVCEIGEPDAGLKVKSGTTVSATEVLCTVPPEVARTVKE